MISYLRCVRILNKGEMDLLYLTNFQDMNRSRRYYQRMKNYGYIKG